MVLNHSNFHSAVTLPTRILKENGLWSEPGDWAILDVELLAERLGFRFDVPVQGTSQSLEPNVLGKFIPEMNLIVLAPKLFDDANEPLARVVAAHEMGHAFRHGAHACQGLLPTLDLSEEPYSASFSISSNRQLESEANQFAIGLLTPLRHVIHELGTEITAYFQSPGYLYSLGTGSRGKASREAYESAAVRKVKTIFGVDERFAIASLRFWGGLHFPPNDWRKKSGVPT